VARIDLAQGAELGGRASNRKTHLNLKSGV
jgi:hypothetical protein